MSDIKIKILFTALTIILLAACSPGRAPQAGSTPELGYQRVGFQGAQDGIDVLESKLNVRYGEQAFIRIQGVPGVEYYISSTYLNGKKLVTIMQHSVAQGDGKVTFTWTIGTQTTAGSYPLVITGGGKALRTRYNVSP